MRLFTILLLLSPALFCSCSEKDDFNWDAMDAISERKSARGDFNIGVLFHNGEDLAQDYVKAAEFFRKSAEWGLPDAQHWLGVMYHYGRGVTEDDTEAAKWFRKAAEQGFTDAQYMLGRLYTNGVGVAEDDVLAYMWWNLAAAQGHEAAKENKGIVSKRMTREQIAEAQKLSREWMAKHSEKE
jgi:TPR repeat protein